jgi:hypothetical protein
MPMVCRGVDRLPRSKRAVHMRMNCRFVGIRTDRRVLRGYRDAERSSGFRRFVQLGRVRQNADRLSGSLDGRDACEGQSKGSRAGCQDTHWRSGWPEPGGLNGGGFDKSQKERLERKTTFCLDISFDGPGEQRYHMYLSIASDRNDDV